MISKNTRWVIAFAALASLASCGGAKKQADKLFYEAAAYNEAAEAYKKLLASNPGSKAGEINAQIGESYRLSNRPGLALPYYKAALDAGEKTDSIRYNAAITAKEAGDFETAKALFSGYSTSGRRQKWMDRSKLELENINKLPTLAAKGSEYEVVNVSALNTASSEYAPLLVSNGEELAFTATRSSAIYKGNGLPFSDVYRVKVADLATGAAPQLAPYDKFNTESRHEASVTFSTDGKMAVFARSNDGSRKGGTDIDLYTSRQDKDGNWSSPELLSISSSTAWDACPALSQDGKTLYFASNREGGKGGTDIYRATQDANGAWTKITNLGSDINTAGDEMYPYALQDGKLYFSSDGHAGFGGQDIFVAVRDKDKGTTIENLGQPMNSKADDFGVTFKNAYQGYFTSSRDGGKGDDDIYSFTNTLLEPKVIRLAIAGTVSGNVGGVSEGALAGAKVRLQEGEQPVGETVTDSEGKFSLPVAEDKNYTVLIEKEGYFTKRDAISTFGKVPPARQLKKENDIAVPYAGSLDKIKIQAAIVVENIYYDYNRANIRTDAAAELDKIVTMLNDNPNITIELSSHTDARGDAKFNQRLSQLRADSAVMYIESKGIADNRIVAKGYGKTKLIVADAATEDDHQKNRRTEFKVTKIEGMLPAKPATKTAAPAAPKGKKGGAKGKKSTSFVNPDLYPSLLPTYLVSVQPKEGC